MVPEATVKQTSTGQKISLPKNHVTTTRITSSTSTATLTKNITIIPSSSVTTIGGDMQSGIILCLCEFVRLPFVASLFIICSFLKPRIRAMGARFDLSLCFSVRIIFYIFFF